jgi:hypothetical protein
MALTIYVDTWENARRISQELKRWAFRGQPSDGWPLMTNFERYANSYNCHNVLRGNREMWILKEFQRRAHHYLTSPPASHDFVEWLALLQHYGGPTRLLDFSHSFYVAAFFAMESAEGPSAIWGINLERLQESIAPFIEQRAGTETIKDSNAKRLRFVNKLLSEKESHRGVIDVEPERLNERLAIQQGLFLFQGDVSLAFNKCLIETFPLENDEVLHFDENTPLDFDRMHSYAILKLVLSRKCNIEGTSDLQRMNLSSATLFPGLDGYARSLRFHLRVSAGILSSSL